MRVFVTLWVVASVVIATRAARAQGTEAEPASAAANPDGGVIDDTDLTAQAGGTGAQAAEQQEMPPGYERPTVDDQPYVTGNDEMIVDENSFVQDQTIADSYDDGYDPQAYTQFEQSLSPYGSWIDDGTYGRVWQPETAVVGTDFVPYYSNGYWTLTEYGWTWVSNWNWGWAPFHYGRWVVLAGRGWCWTPGTMWGPAWVSWRSGGGYVGWAPLPPRGVRVVSHFGPQSGWRFMASDRFGHGRRLDCIPNGQIGGIWRRTGVVSHERVLNRGSWTVRVNAGPVRLSREKAVRMASVAPGNMPQVKILPRAGAPSGMRPWTRGPFNQPPGSGAGGGRPGGGHVGGGSGWVNRPSAPKLAGPAISGPMPSQPMRPVPHVIGSGGGSSYSSRPAATSSQMWRQPQSPSRILPEIQPQQPSRFQQMPSQPSTHQARPPAAFHAPAPAARAPMFQQTPSFQPSAPMHRAPMFQQQPAQRAPVPMHVSPAPRFGGGGPGFGGGGGSPSFGGGGGAPRMGGGGPSFGGGGGAPRMGGGSSFGGGGAAPRMGGGSSFGGGGAPRMGGGGPSPGGGGGARPGGAWGGRR